MGPSGKKAKSTELFRHCIFNPVSCVRGAKIISVCFLWEINFWYSWRAVYSMNAKLIASGLSWSYKKKNWKNHVIGDSFFLLIYWRRGPKNPLKSICYFRRPRSLIPQNKGTCGVDPASVDFSHNLELGGVGSVNGKKQKILCDPDVLMGVNLCYDGLLRLKLFEYKFYWNSRKDWKRSVGRFDGGGKNTTWWMRHPVRWHGACAAGPVNVLRRRTSDNIQNLVVAPENGGYTLSL